MGITKKPETSTQPKHEHYPESRGSIRGMRKKEEQKTQLQWWSELKSLGLVFPFSHHVSVHSVSLLEPAVHVCIWWTCSCPPPLALSPINYVILFFFVSMQQMPNVHSQKIRLHKLWNFLKHFPKRWLALLEPIGGSFALKVERDTDLMRFTVFCRPSQEGSSLSANSIRIISFAFIHFVHFSLNDGSCRWLRHQFRLRHYFLCVRAFCLNGYSCVHLKWCRTRQTKTTFYLIFLCPSSAAVCHTALLHDSKIKWKKWKAKHINNYGSEPERQSESAGTRRAFLEVLPHFFPETTLVHNYLLLPFTINNKWMEATKKNICEPIFHLINSCRFFCSLHLLSSTLLHLVFLLSFHFWFGSSECRAATMAAAVTMHSKLNSNNDDSISETSEEKWLEINFGSCCARCRWMWRAIFFFVPPSDCYCSLFYCNSAQPPAPISFPTRAIRERRSAVESRANEAEERERERQKQSWCVIVVNVVQNDYFV